MTPDPDNILLIRTAKDIYLKFGKDLEALRSAMMLNDVDMIRSIFLACKDQLVLKICFHWVSRLVQKQMAILLGRHQVFLELEGVENGEKLAELNSNAHLYQYFQSLARELDIMEPKTPDGIYKTHLEQTR